MAASRCLPVVVKNGNIGFRMNVGHVMKKDKSLTSGIIVMHREDPKIILPRFVFNNHTFVIFMSNVDGVVSISLMPASDMPAMSISHAVHVINGDRRLDGKWHDISYTNDKRWIVDGVKSATRSNGGQIFTRYAARINLMEWEDLLRVYSNGGVFDILIDFAPSVVLPLFAIPMGTPFNDFIIKTVVDPSFELPCNRLIITSGSKAFNMILKNPASMESQKGILTIGADYATPEIVKLFIEAMYLGWSEEMNKFSKQLLQLADLYQCLEIAAAAVLSVKRQLNERTFWQVAKLAFLMDVNQPALLVAIVDFVMDKPSRMVELIRQDGGQTTEDIARLAHEIRNKEQKAKIDK